MHYYGAFYPSALTTFLNRINTYLLRWIQQKYKRFRSLRQAHRAWARARAHYPRLFAHWAWARHPLMNKRAGAG